MNHFSTIRLLVAALAVGRKENAEKSRRTNMWTATVIAAIGLVVTIVFNLMRNDI
ncbi:hypothetical protein GCM10022419_136240 [Nonomuraea rosea]|uniref:DUF2970 domain-containing protein n=1 Tax=Nonomuraea rosea TaxID=638574 RepID=A0ABP7AAJ5_9ACTN